MPVLVFFLGILVTVSARRRLAENHTGGITRLPSSGGPLRMMVYDFDNTIASAHVYHELRAKFQKREALTRQELENVTDAEWYWCFGGAQRLKRLQQHLSKMADKTTLYVASFGYANELQFVLNWANITHHFRKIVGADNCDSHAKDGFQGWGYNKWDQILIWAKEYAPPLNASDIGFVDDNIPNLDATIEQCDITPTSPICHCFPVSQNQQGHRMGMTLEDMVAIEAQQRLVKDNDARCIDYNEKVICPEDSCPEQRWDPVLCDTEVVEEACLILNGGVKHARGDDWTNSEALREILSSTDHAMSAFWEAVNLPTTHETSDGRGYWVACETLCVSVVDYGTKHGVMPPTSDVACYNVGMETRCDLPMRLSSFSGMGPKPDEDIPDFHDEEVMHSGSQSEEPRTSKGTVVGGLPQTTGTLGGVRVGGLPRRHRTLKNHTGSLVSVGQELAAEPLDYDIWELTERVCNIFRIYPTKKPELNEPDVSDSRSSAQGDGPFALPRVGTASGPKMHVRSVVREASLMERMS